MFNSELFNVKPDKNSVYGIVRVIRNKLSISILTHIQSPIGLLLKYFLEIILSEYANSRSAKPLTIVKEKIEHTVK